MPGKTTQVPLALLDAPWLAGRKIVMLEPRRLAARTAAQLLPWSEHARRLRARMQALRAWLPERGLPDVSDVNLLATLEQWLAPYLHGKHRLDSLRAEDLSQALAARFDHPQRQLLDAQAPEQVMVPSGQSRRLEYAGADSPVLAVKLQELFGLADTPCAWAAAASRSPCTCYRPLVVRSRSPRTCVASWSAPIPR
ncbi:hypothetical protein RLIN73S_00359 [Rhodanobacter lindaniclasticus]